MKVAGDRAVTLGSVGDVMVSTLIPNARDMGLILPLSTICLSFITRTTLTGGSGLACRRSWVQTPVESNQ